MTHRLGIVSTVFNPLGHLRIRYNFERFFDEVLSTCGRDVVVTEVLYADQSPSIPEAVHLHKPGTAPLWDKEAALNVAAQRLPENCTAVAWIDADLSFVRSDWVEAAEQALEEHVVIQLFRWSHWTDIRGNLERADECWAAKWPQYGHPGFAWAARRELFPIDDLHIVGNGDVFNASAWCGKFNTPQLQRYPRQARRDWLVRAWRAYQATGGRIGFIEGSVVHHWHGEKNLRQYNSRLSIIDKHDFDPATDVRRLDNGLLDWIPGHKPQLAIDVQRYFERRRDDG